MSGAPEIRCIVPGDIPGIVDMQARVWQEHFRRERGQEVPMMRRSERNIMYYLAKEPGGCLVAVLEGKILGTIFSHVWGSVGWFGPLEVSPDWQGRGLGKSLVARSVEFLSARGCTTIGCETMASSPRNIAFYRKLGFRETGLSSVFFKSLAAVMPDPDPTDRARPMGVDDIPAARMVWERVHPGLDYGTEVRAALENGLGKVLLMDSGAHAITHTYEMFEESQNAIIKMLAAPGDRPDDVGILLRSCEGAAARAGKTGMFVRAYNPTPPEPEFFFNAGYTLHSVSVRLLLRGDDEAGDVFHVSSWSG